MISGWRRGWSSPPWEIGEMPRQPFSKPFKFTKSSFSLGMRRGYATNGPLRAWEKAAMELVTAPPQLSWEEPCHCGNPWEQPDTRNCADGGWANISGRLFAMQPVLIYRSPTLKHSLAHIYCSKNPS